MADTARSPTSFTEWLRLPQTLIALSALLLSLCGLFVALYEASLIRRTQRASVWPHLQVAASIQPDEVSLWVRNTGVGPARIEAAAVTHDGELQADWDDLLQSVLGQAPTAVRGSYSLINGIVLAAGAERERTFSLAAAGAESPETIPHLSRAILDGHVDLTVCYCSVFEECWTTTLQSLIGRSRAAEPSPPAVEVADCAEAARSGI